MPVFAELDIRLDRNSSVPLYHQLAQSIEHAITSGVLAPGDRLENELSLTNRLGSLPADRAAGDPGAGQEGPAGPQAGRRHPGRPVAVPSRRAAVQPQRGPGQGRPVPSTRLLGVLGRTAGRRRPRRARRRGGHRAATSSTIRRLRLADDVPAGDAHELPSRPVRDRTRPTSRTKSLYGLLRSLGINLKIAHQRISARLMTEEEAELLDEETPAACLTVDRPRLRRRRPVRRVRPPRLPRRALLDPVLPRRLNVPGSLRNVARARGRRTATDRSAPPAGRPWPPNAPSHSHGPTPRPPRGAGAGPGPTAASGLT